MSDIIKIDIDKDRVNEAITAAIVDSAIGDQMRKEIKDQLDRMSQSYNNPIKPIVEEIVRKELYRLIQVEYLEELRAAVKERITEETVQSVVGKAFDAWMEKSKH